MTAFDPIFLVALGLATLVAGIVVVRLLRARRRAQRRVVEMPNSHYRSRTVREIETRHRWHDIELDRVHEVNRGEVERLLAKVEATSVEALRPDERVFLDHMAELFGTTPRAADRQSGRSPAPELRHRPA